MRAAILATADQIHELKGKDAALPDTCIWVKSPEELWQQTDCDLWVDLLFEPDPQRIAALQQKQNGHVVIHSVTFTLRETHPSFIRINGWPGFLARPLMEASGTNDAAKQMTDTFFALFDKKVIWTADEPGFVTARVIAMIINEAGHALAEGVSTPDEIDTAMKAGTHYPYGPFEWAQKIGLKNINELLLQLSSANEKYKPSAFIAAESLS